MDQEQLPLIGCIKDTRTHIIIYNKHYLFTTNFQLVAILPFFNQIGAAEKAKPWWHSAINLMVPTQFSDWVIA